MADAIYVPRINNNDDEVKLVEIQVAIGSQVTKGQIVAQVETDKAVIDVEANADGYVLALLGGAGDVVRVGSVLIWLGKTKDDPVPERETAKGSGAGSLGREPTAKALALLKKYGLDAAVVPASGERLSADDVDRYMVARTTPAASVTVSARPDDSLPDVAGELIPLKTEDRGMLSTVSWHRDVAVPGYIEITYESALWDGYALEFGKKHGLLLNPMLPLMAWRLVELARDTPRLNSTIVGTKRYEYTDVNLGSTVQVGDVLYLAVVRDALGLGELGFVNAMVELQRRANAHKLGPKETQGATLGFSSMARWKVARHIPILSPQTSLMVAHTVGSDGVAVLGATYDHRVVSGSVVASTLRKLSRPGKPG